MTRARRATVALLVALVATIVAATSVQAQWRRPGVVPEPRLIDTPQRDFPLGRLEPGARLRFTHDDGRRSEARLDSLGDSTIALQTDAGDPLPAMTFAELRALRLVEVRALRVGGNRVALASGIGGAAVGALVGLAVHDRRGDRPNRAGRHPGRGEEMAAWGSVGMFVGWYTAFQVYNRMRWRPVTLPRG